MKERLFKEIVIFMICLICSLVCRVLGGTFNPYITMILYWVIRIYVEMVWEKFYD